MGPSLPEDRATIGANSPELGVLVEFLEAPDEELANGFGPNLLPRVGHVRETNKINAAGTEVLSEVEALRDGWLRTMPHDGHIDTCSLVLVCECCVRVRARACVFLAGVA